MAYVDGNRTAASIPPAESRRRRWIGRALYILFLLVVVELAFQGFYRLTTGASLFSRAAAPLYVDDPGGGWALKPNLSFRQRTPEFDVDIFTNSHGFRTSKAREEYAAGRDDSRYRIILLGPSFAFGWGVNYEQTFAAQLTAMLATKGFGGGRRLELINRGVPALAPEFNLGWFKRVGKTYAPDLVIQFIYGSMNLNPAAPTRVKDGYLEALNASLSDRAIGFAKRSAIVFYGWTIVTKALGALSHDGNGTIAGAGRDLTVVDAFDPASPRVSYAMAFYDDLRATVEAAGARLLIVYFPLSYVVHPQDMDRWRHLGVRDPEKQVAYDRAFSDHLGEHGIACLNVTDALVAEARRSHRRLYYWLDIHWTADGNRLVAQSVADWLATRPDWAKHL